MRLIEPAEIDRQKNGIDGVIAGQAFCCVVHAIAAAYPLGPYADGSSSASLVLYCADVDAVFTRAVEAGATIREPVQNFVTGDRYGTLVDPFGRRWAIMTRIENVSREEAARRVKEWLAANMPT